MGTNERASADEDLGRHAWHSVVLWCAEKVPGDQTTRPNWRDKSRTRLNGTGELVLASVGCSGRRESWLTGW